MTISSLGRFRNSTINSNTSAPVEIQNLEFNNFNACLQYNDLLINIF
jgi:hypothetical protein